MMRHEACCGGESVVMSGDGIRASKTLIIPPFVLFKTIMKQPTLNSSVAGQRSHGRVTMTNKCAQSCRLRVKSAPTFAYVLLILVTVMQ